MAFYNTQTAGRILGIDPNKLHRAVWDNKLKAPAKSPSNTYMWTRADIERAAFVLHCLDAFKKWEGENES